MTLDQISFAVYPTRNGKSGFIVRIEDHEGNFGVADLCPWPHLGDLPLSEEIKSKGPLFLRSLELAMEDLVARRDQQVLCEPFTIQNHFLVADWRDFDVARFSTNYIFKFKCGKEYVDFAKWLNANMEKAGRIRLDFNARLEESEFKNFLDLLQPDVLKKIEVIEDPFSFDAKKWSVYSNRVSVASDFEKPLARAEKWPIRINKPSRESFEPDCLYTTSSMDHPIGHVHAMRFAGLMEQRRHGFMTILEHQNSEYFADFEIEQDKIKYKSDGFGVGFERQLRKENFFPFIDWESSQKNQLILDPALSTPLRHLAFSALKQFSLQQSENYILIASSGSSASQDQIKLYAFTKSAFLAAANRVLDHFRIEKGAKIGCVLPFHHVAGLSALARAYVSESEFVVASWKNVDLNWFDVNEIEIISLVPTQVYDLVRNGWKAPRSLKFVFVGAGELSQKLQNQAIALGWPIQATYGMTETIGMIAVVDQFLEDPIYRVMNSVQIKDDDSVGSAKIKTDSCASYEILCTNDGFKIRPLGDADGFIDFPDRLRFLNPNTFQVLGRADQQLKIKGELVNVSKLKKSFTEEFEKILNFELIPLPDDRNGIKLVAVFEQVEELQIVTTTETHLQNFNSRRPAYEHIRHYAFLSVFPKSALQKNRVQLIKDVVLQGKIYEVRKF